MIDLEPDTQIVHMLVGSAGQRIVLGTACGLGFICRLQDLATRQRAGKQFVNLDEGAELMKPVYLRDGDTHLAMLTNKERLLVVALDELRVLGAGGRGTTLMTLDAGDVITQWTALGAGGLLLDGIYRNRATRLHRQTCPQRQAGGIQIQAIGFKAVMNRWCSARNVE